MLFYGIVSIIVALFIIIATFLLIKENKLNIKPVLLNVVLYGVTGVILLTFGIIGILNISDIVNMISVVIMIISLLVLVIFITIDERKGKKVVKLKAVKNGKEKKLVPEDEEEKK